mmetsp:Transcript_16235/g.29459  ORF Transcript_16235/g.29459 Transcript_16235/m.29459 type:complete len:439 (-) Transcript_16235:240-1556(-)
MNLAIASLLVGTAAATSSIQANSKVGKNLLNRARRLDGGNGDMTWAVNYSLKFEKCATSTDYYGGYFGGNQDNNDNDNDNKYNYNGVYEQRLVHFKLCPTDSCGKGCSGGGDYVIDMNEFVMAYMEYKVEAQEAECERVANNCYCENANDDDACAAQCYMTAGIYDQCVEQDNQNNNNGQQEEEFEIQDALECAQLEIDEDAAQYYNYNNQNNNGGGNDANYYNGNYNNQNNNNNNNGEQQDVEFFVGPYCSANGKSILLGVFMDEVCSYAAPEGIYEKFHYGKALPYSSESIISNECISCMEPAEDDGNNNNQNYNYNNGDDNYNNNGNNNNQNQEDAAILEVCERLYEDAGKCETNLNVYGVYPTTLACEFIKGLKASGKSRISSAFSGAKKNVTPQVLAGLFAASTLVFGGVSYYFHQKLQRQNVGLIHGQGNMA